MDRILTIGSAGIAALMALDRIAAAIRAERDISDDTSHWRAASTPVTSRYATVARD